MNNNTARLLEGAVEDIRQALCALRCSTPESDIEDEEGECSWDSEGLLPSDMSLGPFERTPPSQSVLEEFDPLWTDPAHRTPPRAFSNLRALVPEWENYRPYSRHHHRIGHQRSQPLVDTTDYDHTPLSPSEYWFGFELEYAPAPHRRVRSKRRRFRFMPKAPNLWSIPEERHQHHGEQVQLNDPYVDREAIRDTELIEQQVLLDMDCMMRGIMGVSDTDLGYGRQQDNCTCQ